MKKDVFYIAPKSVNLLSAEAVETKSNEIHQILAKKKRSYKYISPRSTGGACLDWFLPLSVNTHPR